MMQTVKSDRPPVLETLKAAIHRHSLVLELVPLTEVQLKQELAKSRAIVELQSNFLAEFSDRVSHDDVMFDAMVQLVNTLDPHIRRGQKVIVSAKKGHVAVHGTEAQKKVKAQRMLEICNRIAEENPRWGITSVLQSASEELKCTERTIRRNLPNIGSVLRPSSK
jgi:hypothetical protein